MNFAWSGALWVFAMRAPDDPLLGELTVVRPATVADDPYIVEEAGDPVGYLQAWFALDLPDEAGLDMFLIPGARDRGLGPDAARTLADWLLNAGGRRRVTVDPYVANERAVRAWTKAGFRPVQEREPDEEHREPWLLMALESDGPTGSV